MPTIETETSLTPQQTPAPTLPAALPAPQVQQPFMPERVTTQMVDAWRARRDELSNQLASAQNRRDQLGRAYERADGANKAGIEQRLAQLDRRILQIESDIAENGRLLSSPAAQIATSAPPRWGRVYMGRDASAAATVVSLFVLGPLAWGVARMLWRRGGRPALPPGWAETQRRIERMEQAMDTIAIEVERVSEGQRFMTRIMTERTEYTNGTAVAPESGLALNDAGQPVPALGPGAPVEIRVPQKEAVRVPRS